jgi:hypothetical protein
VSRAENSIPQLQRQFKVFIPRMKTLSEVVSCFLRDKSLLEIEAYDITLLKLLSKGFIIDEISSSLKTLALPNGSSSIENESINLKFTL